MFDLYPYQEEGIEFLAARDRAYLADKMGLGKTAQAILAANEVGVDKVGVVCPASLTVNWQREWDKWHGRGKIEIVSYNRFVRSGFTRGFNPDLMITDEAHYCKTPSAQRTRSVLSAARGCPKAWLLSGTPMPNHPGEFWTPIKYLWPTTTSCTTYESWQRTFCELRPTPWGAKVVGVRNGGLLRELLQDIMLRRTSVPGLPPLRIHLQWLPKTTVPVSIQSEINDQDSYSSIRRILGETKAPAISNLILEELQDQQYRKIVVLYYHHTVGEILRSGLSSVVSVGFDGTTPIPKRQRAIDAFQTDPKVPVFLAQMTSAGVGLNLTASSEVIIVEPAWTPDENSQAIKRIHRIGQEDHCRARIFGISETEDEHVMDTIYRKIAMQKEVLG